MTKRFKKAILIGRFEPNHNGHLANFVSGLEIADKIQILVGSSYQARTPKNPFKFTERKEMILTALKNIGTDLNRVCIEPIRDFKYSNSTWISQVQQSVKKVDPQIADAEICIMGYDKDDSSWYNHAFPNWKFISLDGYVEFGSKPIDATKIRSLYFEGDFDYMQGAVPKSVFNYLTTFAKTPEYIDLVAEYEYYRQYKQDWSVAPYPVIFQTTDAVVVQGGHILLIQRKVSPGKGLWALPGGFLNPNETLEDGCIRELTEETRIKVPEKVLRGSITHEKRFDHPDRSLRGRTITTAFLIELTGPSIGLPKVKPRDDAKNAKFFTFAEVLLLEEELFEDHNHIIHTMIARAKK